MNVHTDGRWYMGVLVAVALLASMMPWSAPVTEASTESGGSDKNVTIAKPALQPVVIANNNFKTDSPVENYGVKLPSSFAIQLPMKGQVSLRTSSNSHNCYGLNQQAGSAQDCYAIDFVAADAGVYAIADGIVRLVVSDFRTQTTSFVCYGNMVIVEHPNNYWSLYAHLKSVASLQENTAVSRGQRIGEMGDTGKDMNWKEGSRSGTCGPWAPHLHMAVYSGAKISNVASNKGPYGGASVAIGYGAGDATFTGCVVNSNARCDQLYRHRLSGTELKVSSSGSTVPDALTIVSPMENGTTENGLIKITVSGGVAPYYLEVMREGSSSPFIYQTMNGTSYQPDSLSWSQSYRGRLCARITDKKGTTTRRCFSNGSASSPVPSTPRGLKIKDIKSKEAKIDWDSQSSVKYFCVNWSRDNVTPQGCDVKVQGKDSSYKPTDLKADKTYYVWVQACSDSGCSSATKTQFKTKR